MSYKITTDVPWNQTMNALAEEFRKWKIVEWSTNKPKGMRLEGYREQPIEDREVRLTYYQDDRPVTLTMNTQKRAVDNLRAIFLSIEAMRLLEKRGLTETVRSAYMQLAAPEQKRNPYDVLMILPDSPIEVAEAVFRSLAKKHHPDTGGSMKTFKELNDAINEIRKEKDGSNS